MIWTVLGGVLGAMWEAFRVVAPIVLTVFGVVLGYRAYRWFFVVLARRK